MTRRFTRITRPYQRDALAIAVCTAAVAVSPVIQFALVVVLDVFELDAGLPDTVFVLGSAGAAGVLVIGVLNTRWGSRRALAYGLITVIASSAVVAYLYAVLPLYNL